MYRESGWPLFRKFVSSWWACNNKWERLKGIVMDGRDIGTVVFPDAELKLFMTASAEYSGSTTL